jgi:hypothetical protein
MVVSRQEGKLPVKVYRVYKGILGSVEFYTRTPVTLCLVCATFITNSVSKSLKLGYENTT